MNLDHAEVLAAGEHTRTHVATLDWGKVDQIRSRYAEGGITQKQLGIEYGVTRQTIDRVLNNRTWHPANDPRRDQ